MINIKKFNKEGLGCFRCITIGDNFLESNIFFLGIDIAKILQHSNLTQAISRVCIADIYYKVLKSKSNGELFDALKNEKIIGNKCGAITLLTSSGVMKMAFNNETLLEKIKFIEWLRELNIIDKNLVLFKNREEHEFGDILVPFLTEKGYDVERQYSIHKYRLDFFIRRFNFCIELDEIQHLYQKFEDSQRDKYLREEEGILTVRVNHKDNYGQAIAVIEKTLTEWIRSECFE